MKKPWSKKKKIIVGVVAVLVIFGLASGGSDDDTQQADTQPEEIVSQEEGAEEYSLNFNPEITVNNTESSIDVSFDVDCPDGTILSISAVSADMSEVYGEEVPVKDRKASASFPLEDTTTREFIVACGLFFNNEEIVQPEATKALYGEKGENLEGENSVEAPHKDGTTGRNGAKTFIVGFPSDEAVFAEKKKIFDEYVNTVVENSNGAILDIQDKGEGQFWIIVSNTWYLFSEEEKQYFAEEMSSAITTIGQSMYGSDEYIGLFIYDENMNELAAPGLTGGMKVKR